jgi:Gas vesicle synthesis protein GvpL/GvpF
VAAVGEMAERPAVSEATLRAHDAVIRRLADTVDAILPVRFGALLSESALTDALAARGRELTEALALVAGREQMTLRLMGEAVPRRAPAAVSDHPELGPGARYLAARRAEWRRAREAPELEPLRPALQPLVRAERVTRHDAPPLLASVYHLIDRGASAAYLSAVERAGGPTPVRIVVTGPWPPYAFAPEALG